MQRLARAGTGIAVLCLVAAPSGAQLFGPEPHDPRTYASPSGHATLFVDPSQPSGAGPANYRCTLDGRELWAGKRPYTLWEAEVTDDGLVAGYAYAAGRQGGRDDALTIVLLDPSGKARLEERLPREGMISDVGSPNLLVNGLFVDAEHDRLVVRVKAEKRGSAESWWTYALSSGAKGVSIDPRAQLGGADRIGWILGARALPGTELTLVQWNWNDFAADEDGALFTLLDGASQIVWRLDWRDDYTVPGDKDASRQRYRDAWQHGAILATAPRRFELRCFATDERITFEVERVSGAREGLEVREIARAPFAASASAKPAEPAALELAHLGSIRLGADAPASPIHDVLTFAFDGAGRAGLLRREGERVEFVRVDADGTNALVVPLPTSDAWPFELAWTAGERWILLGTVRGEKPQLAWWLDAASRSVMPLEGYAGPSVESVAGTPPGGFVALGTTWYDSGYLTSDLVCYDRDGRRLFALGGDQGDPNDPSTLFAPECVAVLANGEIVVLSNIQKTLQFFAPTGEFERVVELEAAWGREPNYPAGLHADVDGGLIVYDFNGSPPTVRVDGAGRIRGQFEARFADGRRLARGEVQLGPGGSLWATDGQALLELDAEGVVRRVLGAAPDAATLGAIAGVTLGADDRIYAVDRRTGAVHVFSPAGEPQHVCTPAPGDFKTGLTPSRATVSDAGVVYVGRVRFGPDGARLEGGAPKAIAIQPSCYAQRGSERLWMLGYRALYLVDANGQAVRTIERTPDDRWLRNLDSAGVAPDGSLALAAGNRGDAHHGLCLYGPEGEPRGTLPRPEGMPGWSSLAFDGVRLAIPLQREKQPGSVLLMDTSGRALGRFTPPGKVALWQPFFAAGGKELWLFDGERTLERYALP